MTIEEHALREPEADADAPSPDHRRGFGRLLLSQGVQPLLLGGDALALAVAGLVTRPAPVGLLLTTLITGVLYRLAGLYRSRLTLSLLDDLPQLTGRIFVAVTVLVGLDVLLGRAPDRRLLLAAGLGSVLVVAVRSASYALVAGLRARRFVAHRTLVIGAGQVGGQVARQMLDHPSHGLQPVGFLDVDPLLTSAERILPLLGSQRDLAKVIAEQRVTVVIVAFGSLRESEMVDVIRTCDRLHCEIFFVPRLFELYHTGPELDQLWGLPLIRLQRAAFRTTSWRFKRPFDVALALCALLLLAPALALIAVAVRLEGGPGVLFRQERVGLDGRVFSLLKFRTLRPASEAESQTMWNIAHDHRLGPVGRVLRRTSLDELPQLINVVSGDMSLVGPRPERPHFVSEFARTFPRYPDRHRVPSGLTGWAQVHGLRGDTSIADRARFDNYYIENWSIWTDVKILLRTVGAVLRRQGA